MIPACPSLMCVCFVVLCVCVFVFSNRGNTEGTNSFFFLMCFNVCVYMFRFYINLLQDGFNRF